MEYTLRKDFKETDSGQLITVYGISCADETVKDISCDKAAMLELVEKCNRYELDPVHLGDIIEDFLNA